MKRLIFSILTLLSQTLFAQDTTAYSLFNSYYAPDKYVLLSNADSYSLDTADIVFLQQCIKLLPTDILRELKNQKSRPFNWDKNKLSNTVLVEDSLSDKNDLQTLRLSSPIFDSNKRFALIHEAFDAGSCVHAGPVLFQYRDKKWTIIASKITSYHFGRGKTMTRE